jgi:oligoendopeptidase F
MPAQTRRSLAKLAPKPSGKGLGTLPEWDLSALYAGIDDPAVKRDLDRADRYSIAFEEDFKGKLAALADAPDAGAKLAEAVIRYEQLDDLLGRLISYAGLIHAGDTVDPARAKFYGDVQERITAASTHLVFFVLELNRIDDKKLEAAMADPKLGHYTSARTSPTSLKIASSSSSTRSR